jgi:hypothetical protein
MESSAAQREIARFPKAGVKISYVVGDFVEELGGVDRLSRGMTTEDVCQNIIKPRTFEFEAQSSFCDVLRRREATRPTPQKPKPLFLTPSAACSWT